MLDKNTLLRLPTISLYPHRYHIRLWEPWDSPSPTPVVVFNFNLIGQQHNVKLETVSFQHFSFKNFHLLENRHGYPISIDTCILTHAEWHTHTHTHKKKKTLPTINRSFLTLFLETTSCIYISSYWVKLRLTDTDIIINTILGSSPLTFQSHN